MTLISASSVPLAKTPSGVQGFDEVVGGGLPKNRTTLVVGGPGAGKTMFGMGFVVHGARDLGEPGVFMSFEESRDDLLADFSEVNFDLEVLVAEGKLGIESAPLHAAQLRRTGAFGLEGLFVWLGQTIDRIGAKRVTLDTIDVLLAVLGDGPEVRSEIHQLFVWLREKGVTTLVTAESAKGQLTRLGMEEFVSDCVVLLDNRLQDQVATRRLRVLKYRGGAHGANEYPFLIGRDGLSVLPITSLRQDYEALTERLSTGVADLDAMLDGKGYFRGSNILVSGSAGTGKTTLAASFARAACERGEACLYIAFEESTSQILRNAQSVGIDLRPLRGSGLLSFHSVRPTMTGLETHLAEMMALVETHQPRCVVVDPVTNLVTVGSRHAVQAMLARLVDFMRRREITTLFTSLTSPGQPDAAAAHVSSQMDTWIVLRMLSHAGQQWRALSIVKSRGMPHADWTGELRLSGEGVALTRADPALFGAGPLPDEA